MAPNLTEPKPEDASKPEPKGDTKKAAPEPATSDTKGAIEKQLPEADNPTQTEQTADAHASCHITQACDPPHGTKQKKMLEPKKSTPVESTYQGQTIADDESDSDDWAPPEIDGLLDLKELPVLPSRSERLAKEHAEELAKGHGSGQS